jgi:CRP/FNR family transcriptional regulator, cyclic AMP receptor protein
MFGHERSLPLVVNGFANDEFHKLWAPAKISVVTMRVAKTEIQRVIRDEPAFSQMFVSHLLARNIRVEEDLLDQLFNSTERRLARLLLLLANFGKEGRPEPLIAKISHAAVTS